MNSSTPSSAAIVADPLAEPRIRRHAAADAQPLQSRSARAPGASWPRARRRPLPGSSRPGRRSRPRRAGSRRDSRILPAERVEDRRLQAGEAEDQPIVVQERSGKGERLAIAALRHALDRRARRDIPGRGGWPPCRTLRRPRRRSCRPGASTRAGSGRGRGWCVPPRRPGRRTDRPRDRDRRAGRRRDDLRGGRRRSAGSRAPAPGPWPPSGRRPGHPTSPGRVATATASRSRSETPARRRASSIIGRIWRTCARDAISGTTPPYR